MHEEEFRLLDNIEDDHWWFVGKRLLLEALLDRLRTTGRLLDLGCGTGGILRHLASTGIGCDRSELALQVCRQKGFARLVRCDLTAPAFRAGAFDTIFLMDVIEHLDDDVGFLRGVARLSSPTGRIVVSVPAFQFLWSKHDETFEHRRRYSAGQLRAVVAAAGLVAERVTYTNCLIFPAALLWRTASYRLGLGRFAPRTDFWPLPRPLNTLLSWTYALEARLLRRRNLPFGVSVVCIARPRDEAARPANSAPTNLDPTEFSPRSTRRARRQSAKGPLLDLKGKSIDDEVGAALMDQLPDGRPS